MTIRLLALLTMAGVVLGALPASAEPSPMTRDAIVDLCKAAKGYSYYWGHASWRMDGKYHGSCSGSCPSCTHSGSYGADCSGLVGKCWQVPHSSPVTENYHPYSTYNFRYESTHWSRLSSRDAAKKADAFVYNSNGSGHIVLYVSGNAWGTPWVYECKGCSYGCVYNQRSLSSSYIGIRRDHIQDTTTGKLQGAVFVDHGSGTGDMSEKLAGATVKVNTGASTTSRDGDGYWSFTLNAGTYTITASKSGYKTASRADCKVTGGDDWCSIGLVKECSPACSGKVCGGDGCGGSCGSCAAGTSCSSGQCVCAPACTGKVCGDDGCGGSCGSCAAGTACDAAGQCACTPWCSGKACGDDGCGGSCGQCLAGDSCSADGHCLACVPACQNRQCGPDPLCGTSCGTCPFGQACGPAGACQDCTADCAGRACGPDPSCGDSCGKCDLDKVCDQTSHQCSAIDPSYGKLHGRVVQKPANPDADLTTAAPVAGASLETDAGDTAHADKEGNYELLVLPGEHLLIASAPGFVEGSVACAVEAGGHTECTVPLQHRLTSTEGVEPVISGGCATADPAGGLAFLGLILAGLLRARRRRD